MKEREIQKGRYLEKILRSREKWFLGGGKTVIWAPPFPRYLDIPGFWDHIMWLDTSLSHLFTVAFLKDGKPLSLKALKRSWVPSHLTIQYSPIDGLRITEEKTVLPDDTLVSCFKITNESGQPVGLDAVMWGFVEGDDIGLNRLDNFKHKNGQIQLTKHILDKAHLKLTYALDKKPTSFRVKVSSTEGWGEVQSIKESPITWNDISPSWEVSPFYDEFENGRLPNIVTFKGELENSPDHNPLSKWLFFALHSRIDITPNREGKFSAMVNVGSDNQSSTLSIKKVISGVDPVKISSDNQQDFFKQVPYFTCSDKFIVKYYWYRWYGLKFNSVEYKSKAMPYPGICEGPTPGWFRRHIVSAAMFMRDVRWMHNPELAESCLLNFITTQREDGSFATGLSTGTGTVYDAGAFLNWGDGVKAVFQVHQDKGFLRRCYGPLVKLMEYLDRERDKEKSGLYDVTNQGQTGAEYMSRYLFVDPNADEWKTIQLKAVDATVYVYQFLKALTWMSDLLEKTKDSRRWAEKADKTAEAVRNKMWDEKTKMFYDVHPKTFRRSPYKVSTSFFPFMTDIVTKEHLPAIYEHLFNPKEFWTPYPVPTISVDDPYFSPSCEWRGKIQCGWNGAVWLLANSHIAEGLCSTALRLDESLKPRAAEFIKKFIRMLFLDGDLNRPTSYECYNPFTGSPLLFRRVDDYMHCWIIDLIIKYVAGLRIEEDGKIIVDPFDFGLKYFLLDNVICQGHRLKIEWKNSVLRVEVEGKTAHSRKGLGKLCMEI